MKKQYVLLTLSLFIAALDIIFVYINYNFSQSNLTAKINTDARHSHLTFNVALDQTYSDLLMVATLYAKTPEIQDLFYNGMKAVHAEGGGSGEAQADLWRKRLFDLVGPSWLQASKDFRIRQLHFHLGPGSTSFLRVHRADKFGDNMDNVRHTIVEANKTLESQTGFETGRVYSGLRGVVPMFATDPITGEQVHTGALETGTSFSKIIEILDDGLGSAFTVLLTRDHIKETMWPAAQKKVFGDMDVDCRCVVEATSRPGVEELLRMIPFDNNGRPQLETPYMLKLGELTYAATFFPLRDFLGQKDPSRKNVGAVLVWQDITADLHELEQQQWINIIYAVLGFVLLEILLIIAFRMVTTRLEHTVEERTHELECVNRQLKQEITVKNRFFSIIAHDLRSPFNTLLGMTRLIEDYVDRYDKDKLRGFAAHISDAGENFYELLKGLLEWSRHQMQEDSIELTDFTLTELVDDVLLSLSASADDKAVTVLNAVDGTEVRGDFHMISTVVRNLVSNAIKFVEHGGRIDVNAQVMDGYTQINVTDNGVGFDEANIHKLFSLDQKVTTPGTEGERGTGLGLPLCKDLVDLHGGNIHAENLNEGGARVSFTLPHA